MSVSMFMVLRGTQVIGAGFLVTRHDCSTLGGNSGSPVVDLASHTVLGLLFRGEYLQANSAVALWTLADHPELSRLELSFVRAPGAR